MLRELKHRAYKLGVVTHKIRERMLDGMHTGLVREVDDLGWRGLFDVLIGMEDTPHLKPDPDGILNALARLRLPPEQALYIGDSASDMEAARAAGCGFILAAWGAHKPVAGSPGGKPLHTAQTPQDVLRLIADSGR
jgi:phosphoglycolate phosphatase-like HAD superfamily hydrolase